MNRFHFDKLNWILLLVGVLLMIAAFIIMGSGDNTVSPLLLTIVYLIIFPWAIMRGFKAREDDPKQE